MRAMASSIVLLLHPLNDASPCQPKFQRPNPPSLRVFAFTCSDPSIRWKGSWWPHLSWTRLVILILGLDGEITGFILLFEIGNEKQFSQANLCKPNHRDPKSAYEYGSFSASCTSLLLATTDRRWRDQLPSLFDSECTVDLATSPFKGGLLRLVWPL